MTTYRRIQALRSRKCSSSDRNNYQMISLRTEAGAKSEAPSEQVGLAKKFSYLLDASFLERQI